LTDTSLRRNIYSGFELGMNARLAHRILVEGTALSSTVVPFLSSDPRAGGVPSSILQPRLIRLGAQIKF